MDPTKQLKTLLSNGSSAIGAVALMCAALSVERLWSVPASAQLFGPRTEQSTWFSFIFLYGIFFLWCGFWSGVAEKTHNLLSAIGTWITDQF